MKLTKQTLYQLIQEALEDDLDPNYADLYDSSKPVALYHEDDDTEHQFYLYHLTDNPAYPVYVVSYLSMGLLGTDDLKCIPFTFQVMGTYTESNAQKKGFSKTLYNIAFYIASKYHYRILP